MHGNVFLDMANYPHVVAVMDAAGDVIVRSDRVKVMPEHSIYSCISAGGRSSVLFTCTEAGWNRIMTFFRDNDLPWGKTIEITGALQTISVVECGLPLPLHSTLVAADSAEMFLEIVGTTVLRMSRDYTVRMEGEGTWPASKSDMHYTGEVALHGMHGAQRPDLWPDSRTRHAVAIVLTQRDKPYGRFEAVLRLMEPGEDVGTGAWRPGVPQVFLLKAYEDVPTRSASRTVLIEAQRNRSPVFLFGCYMAADRSGTDILYMAPGGFAVAAAPADGVVQFMDNVHAGYWRGV
jgi:hypothetical protein